MAIAGGDYAAPVLIVRNATGGDVINVPLGQTVAIQTNASPRVTIGDSTITLAVNIDSSGGFTKYDNISTAGLGIPAIYAAPAISTANAAALTNYINYTPPASAGRYRLAGVCNMISWVTPATFTVVVTYKDENGTARSDIPVVFNAATGTSAGAGAITAVGRWNFTLEVAVDNSATAITVSTVGTFTGTPSYDFWATLEQLA